MEEKQNKKKLPKQVKFSRPTTAFKHKQVLDKLAENGGDMGDAIRATKLYSEEIALNPQKITESKTWNELMEFYISDEELISKHKELLNSTFVDHMIFPTGCKLNSEKESYQKLENEKAIKKGETPKELDLLSDEDIKEMLGEVNCKVRRIVHGETARHVYFWASDNTARDKALDKAYKLKSRYSEENKPTTPQATTYNFFFNADVQREIKEIENRIKQQLIKPNVPTLTETN